MVGRREGREGWRRKEGKEIGKGGREVRGEGRKGHVGGGKEGGME